MKDMLAITVACLAFDALLVRARLWAHIPNHRCGWIAWLAHQVLNFAAFLEEHEYFEESFTAFEKGVSAFKWPHVKVLWHAYLDKFLER